MIGDYAEITIMVERDKTNGQANIQIGFPREQENLSVKEAAHILVAGINILIKACSKTDTGIKDHVLLTEIIEHLNDAFIETANDVMVRKELFNLEENDNSTSSTNK